MNESFLKDVISGLSKTNKTLPSKYFYDEKGDALFSQIMRMPEYYLTDCEFEILETKSTAIIDGLSLDKTTHFELIELGAGDGYKTKLLLQKLLELGYRFTYIPIDISENALTVLTKNLQKELPSLKIAPQQGDFFERIKALYASKDPKVLMFLGSTLGNMTDDSAEQFLARIGRNIKPGEHLILGVDLIKSQEVVLPAYDDSQKITAEFNLNLLSRINRELDGNFNTSLFHHKAEYTEQEGIARSFLISDEKQEVSIGNEVFSFDEGERIHTEISRKYNDQVLGKILHSTTYKIKDRITDSKHYFADYILQVSDK